MENNVIEFNNNNNNNTTGENELFVRNNFENSQENDDMESDVEEDEKDMTNNTSGKNSQENEEMESDNEQDEKSSAEGLLTAENPEIDVNAKGDDDIPFVSKTAPVNVKIELTVDNNEIIPITTNDEVVYGKRRKLDNSDYESEYKMLDQSGTPMKRGRGRPRKVVDGEKLKGNDEAKKRRGRKGYSSKIESQFDMSVNSKGTMNNEIENGRISKGRGRPRKDAVKKRGRGRPKKSFVTDNRVRLKVSSVYSQSNEDEDDDDDDDGKSIDSGGSVYLDYEVKENVGDDENIPNIVDEEGKNEDEIVNFNDFRNNVTNRADGYCNIAAAAGGVNDDDDEEEEEDSTNSVNNNSLTVKRGRGRPRSKPIRLSSVKKGRGRPKSNILVKDLADVGEVKRGPGRPKKSIVSYVNVRMPDYVKEIKLDKRTAELDVDKGRKRSNSDTILTILKESNIDFKKIKFDLKKEQKQNKDQPSVNRGRGRPRLSEPKPDNGIRRGRGRPRIKEKKTVPDGAKRGRGRPRVKTELNIVAQVEFKSEDKSVVNSSSNNNNNNNDDDDGGDKSVNGLVESKKQEITHLLENNQFEN